MLQLPDRHLPRFPDPTATIVSCSTTRRTQSTSDAKRTWRERESGQHKQAHTKSSRSSTRTDWVDQPILQPNRHGAAFRANIPSAKVLVLRNETRHDDVVMQYHMTSSQRIPTSVGRPQRNRTGGETSGPSSPPHLTAPGRSAVNRGMKRTGAKSVPTRHSSLA